VCFHGNPLTPALPLESWANYQQTFIRLYECSDVAQVVQSIVQMVPRTCTVSQVRGVFLVSCRLRYLELVNEFRVCGSVHLHIFNKTSNQMQQPIVIFIALSRRHCSTCFGHYCAHHQEPPPTAFAASGYRIIAG
jgi:hypothetical protein